MVSEIHNYLEYHCPYFLFLAIYWSALSHIWKKFLTNAQFSYSATDCADDFWQNDVEQV